MGVIFIAHDLGVVSEIADKIAVMYKGNIVETNSRKEIFVNPQHPYTKGLTCLQTCIPSKRRKIT